MNHSGLGNIVELDDSEIEMVDGALGIGSVSSDAVFGAGVAIVLSGGGNPVSDVIGGALIGWSIA